VKVFLLSLYIGAVITNVKFKNMIIIMIWYTCFDDRKYLKNQGIAAAPVHFNGTKSSTTNLKSSKMMWISAATYEGPKELVRLDRKNYIKWRMWKRAKRTGKREMPLMLPHWVTIWIH
jgi:hypothetical protein